ncbi:hypothetical protein FJQ54_03705 [Sandaracinobacter neustonicus]|uniref:PepSY domain-containing protein n=1 Tax=Sandaracinobacter neustonicus TaxID=1715348 RepID=A0A501XTZ0_9SPHN|nr:hypothetical protein [Sandaracinobacter neustonicus]TPE63955.1 hypothetical protein FJQ54_03705 [Sandaracinobacter neustonicus]
MKILHPSLSRPSLALALVLWAVPALAFGPGPGGGPGGGGPGGGQAERGGPPQGPFGRGRPISDHDQARMSTRSGENLGFEQLMRSAQTRGHGEYLGVEPDISRNVYRFKFLRPGGNVVWVDVDGRTGRVVSERE